MLCFLGRRKGDEVPHRGVSKGSDGPDTQQELQCMKVCVCEGMVCGDDGV